MFGKIAAFGQWAFLSFGQPVIEPFGQPVLNRSVSQFWTVRPASFESYSEQLWNCMGHGSDMFQILWLQWVRKRRNNNSSSSPMPAQSLATKSHQAHCKATLLAITKAQRPSCNRAAPSYHCLRWVKACSRQIQCQKQQWWHAHLYSSTVNLKQRKAVEAPLATIDFAIQATFEASLSLLVPRRLKQLCHAMGSPNLSLSCFTV